MTPREIMGRPLGTSVYSVSISVGGGLMEGLESDEYSMSVVVSMRRQATIALPSCCCLGLKCYKEIRSSGS